MSLGIDIEEVERFNMLSTHSFIIQNFTSQEITYAYSKTKPQIHLCGIFCAKEAIVKCLKGSCLIKDIEIIHTNGVPLAQIKEKKKLKIDDKNFEISISHTTSYAVACAQIKPISKLRSEYKNFE